MVKFSGNISRISRIGWLGDFWRCIARTSDGGNAPENDVSLRKPEGWWSRIKWMCLIGFLADLYLRILGGGHWCYHEEGPIKVRGLWRTPPSWKGKQAPRSQRNIVRVTSIIVMIVSAVIIITIITITIVTRITRINYRHHDHHVCRRLHCHHRIDDSDHHVSWLFIAIMQLHWPIVRFLAVVSDIYIKLQLSYPVKCRRIQEFTICIRKKGLFWYFNSTSAYPDSTHHPMAC